VLSKIHIFEELADMHLAYGVANGNGRETARIYGERFPNKQQHHHTSFTVIHRCLRELGKFEWSMTDARRDRRVRTVALEENVLDPVANNPRTSVRTVAHKLGTSASTVWRVLRGQLLDPFRFQKVQDLNRNDFDQRVHFCRWFLNSTE
jgi:hypothetical protein